MDTVHKLENVVAGWYKQSPVPHLPSGGQTWLARNVWWIALIGVIVGSLGVISALSLSILASLMFTGLGGAAGMAAGGVLILATFVSMGFAIANIIVLAVAIPHLKAMRRHGWDLLFIAALINAAGLVIGLLLNPNIFSLIFGAICIAIALYFMYEIKKHFVAGPAPRKVAARPTK